MRLMSFGTLMLMLLLPSFYTVLADIRLDDGKLTNSDLLTRAQLEQRVSEIKADPENYQEALYRGERRATLCKACHGEQGNSLRVATPSLAGQNPAYIVDQLNRYADGRRLDYWMRSLSANFTDEDKITLAIYYAAQETKPAKGGNRRLMNRGKKLYQTHCVECHGNDGRSTEGYARLAGQRPEYTIKMLNEFKTAAGRRFNPSMFARANMLTSNADIEAVATYLAHLK